ncbi:hypothetical protein BDI4_970017 [Burkholderia diffusa]|nr:hypothetical protein BDI4_970017 [Burkholderia diffusa]
MDTFARFNDVLMPRPIPEERALSQVTSNEHFVELAANVWSV